MKDNKKNNSSLILRDNTALSRVTEQIETTNKLLAKIDNTSLREWWDGLDNKWQRIMKLNLAVELEMGGIKSQMKEHQLNFEKFEELYEKGELGKRIGIDKEFSDDLLNKLVNLDTIIASRNEIIDLTPLSKLKKLKYLECRANKIENLEPLKNLTNLQEIDLSFNQITSVRALTNLKKLRKLVLMMNNILTLEPIDDLENLEELECTFNFDNDSYLNLKLSNKWEKLKSLSAHNISEIENLPKFCPDLESLFVQGLKGNLSIIVKLKRLKVLYINTNQIMKLDPLIELVELKKLSLTRNRVESIEPIRYLNKLEDLEFDINKIVDLSPLNELKNLKFLDCKNNKIENLEPLEDLTNLEVLDFSNDINYSKYWESNKVTSLKPLKKLIKLKRLNCNNNPIQPKEIALFKATHPNCEIVF